MDKNKTGSINVNEIEDLLHDTYGFPPLEDEVQMFMSAFN